MKCILRIGHTDILLPDHKGVEKIVDMLSKGMEVRKDYDTDYYKPVIRMEREVNIGFELLSPTTKFEVSEELQEKVAKVTPSKRVPLSRKLLTGA